MTAGARGNGFATVLDRLSLWTAIKKLMGNGANRERGDRPGPRGHPPRGAKGAPWDGQVSPQRTLTTGPDSTILRIERAIFFSLFGRSELSQVIRTHLLRHCKDRSISCCARLD